MNLHNQSNSLFNHSIRAVKNQNTPISLLANSLVASSGESGWHLIKSRAASAFSQTIFFVVLMSPFPVLYIYIYTVAGRTKRMPDEHADGEGPGGKRRKKEQAESTAPASAKVADRVLNPAVPRQQ